MIKILIENYVGTLETNVKWTRAPKYCQKYPWNRPKAPKILDPKNILNILWHKKSENFYTKIKSPEKLWKIFGKTFKTLIFTSYFNEKLNNFGVKSTFP